MDRTLQKGLYSPPELAPKSTRGDRGIPGASEDCLSPQGEFRSLQKGCHGRLGRSASHRAAPSCQSPCPIQQTIRSQKETEAFDSPALRRVFVLQAAELARFARSDSPRLRHEHPAHHRLGRCRCEPHHRLGRCRCEHRGATARGQSQARTQARAHPSRQSLSRISAERAWACKPSPWARMDATLPRCWAPACEMLMMLVRFWKS